MEIKYLGHASFFIKSKDARLVTDPFDPQMVGLRFPKTEADIVTVSHSHHDHDKTDLVAGNPLILNWPGQFEKNGMRITGYLSYHDKKKGAERGENVMYKIDADEVTILHCGDLGFVPEDSFLDEIGEIDVLLVPVGGIATIDPNEAMELIKKVEPSIVVPMHYKNPQMNQQIFGQFSPVADFLRKMGVENLTPIPKLVIKKEEFEVEMKVVLLEI